jgi:hypothetical protein
MPIRWRALAGYGTDPSSAGDFPQLLRLYRVKPRGVV